MTKKKITYDTEMKNLDKNIEKLRKLSDDIINTDGLDVSAIEALEEFSYNLAWEKVYELKWIAESDVLLWTLEFFAKKKDVVKCEYLVWMLNMYYNGFILEKFNESIENEDYETCDLLKVYVK